MSFQERGNTLAKVNFMKLHAITDLSGMPFKDVTSLSEDVSSFLNVDSRLECNLPKTPRPDIQAMYDKIQHDRAKICDHQNDLPDEFQANSNLFKFLGLMTCPELYQFNLRDKPILFKSH